MYSMRYEKLNFERRGLFELLSTKFRSANVLYPGCGVHITPSFYFHHVIYMDRSRETEIFFEDYELINNLILKNKVYKQSPYYIFSSGDFKVNSELFKYKFDLLISLYADDVIKNCLQYLKPGGIILSNNYRNEVNDLLQKNNLKLMHKIRQKDGRYMLESEELCIESRDESQIQTNLITKSGDTVQYSDNEIYYILKKG